MATIADLANELFKKEQEDHFRKLMDYFTHPPVMPKENPVADKDNYPKFVGMDKSQHADRASAKNPWLPSNQGIAPQNLMVVSIPASDYERMKAFEPEIAKLRFNVKELEYWRKEVTLILKAQEEQLKIQGRMILEQENRLKEIATAFSCPKCGGRICGTRR